MMSFEEWWKNYCEGDFIHRATPGGESLASEAWNAATEAADEANAVRVHTLLDAAGIPDSTQDGTLLTLAERFQVVQLHTKKFMELSANVEQAASTSV
jgi:hypothetical protein